MRREEAFRQKRSEVLCLTAFSHFLLHETNVACNHAHTQLCTCARFLEAVRCAGMRICHVGDDTSSFSRSNTIQAIFHLNERELQGQKAC